MLGTETPASVIALRKAGPTAKPRLRGVSHLVAFLLAPLFAVALIAAAHSARAVACAVLYGLVLIALFGVSALYHVRAWGPRGRAWLSRADHATIFVFIAASCVPICWIGVGGRLGIALVAAVALGAALGLAQTFFWSNAPRSWHIALYALICLPAVPAIPAQRARLGDWQLALQLVGGASYLLGALIYSRRRPDPIPAIFGYHEVFHALVIAATGCFYAAIYRCILLG